MKYIPITDIDFRDFIQDWDKFSDTSFLPPLTPSDIKEINLGLKLTGGGHLETPAKLFNLIIDLLSIPPSNICNKRVQRWYFPNLYKISRVICKPEDPSLLNNYRLTRYFQ